VNEFVCKLVKCGVFDPVALWVSEVSPVGFQRQMIMGLVSPLQGPRVEMSDMLLFRDMLLICEIILLVCHCTGNEVFGETGSLSLLPISV